MPVGEKGNFQVPQKVQYRWGLQSASSNPAENANKMWTEDGLLIKNQL